MHLLVLSIIIPAFNEGENLEATLTGLRTALCEEKIPYEILVVDDNSRDSTPSVLARMHALDARISLVQRRPPGGFGRAIRTGVELAKGDVIAIFMADQSDHPRDLIRCYSKIEEGYDCVFGTRFSRKSTVNGYPRVKLIVNRIVNRTIQLMFWTRHNDLTNAFKVYRSHVVRDCGPYSSSHFNITIEMSLSALIRGYSIASIPIDWEGRTWGTSNLRISEMGRRYLNVLLKIFLERLLIGDDLVADRLARQLRDNSDRGDLERRLSRLEDDVRELRIEIEETPRMASAAAGSDSADRSNSENRSESAA